MDIGFSFRPENMRIGKIEFLAIEQPTFAFLSLVPPFLPFGVIQPFLRR